MENLVIYHSLNYVPPAGEYNEEPSLTQPDEVLTIREMLLRHARGIALETHHQEPRYYDESMGFIPDIESMDLVDIQETRDALSRRVKAIKDKLNKDNQPNLPRGERPPEAPLSPSPSFADGSSTAQGMTVSDGAKPTTQEEA